jgi:hypothetical protein
MTSGRISAALVACGAAMIVLGATGVGRAAPDRQIDPLPTPTSPVVILGFVVLAVAGLVLLYGRAFRPPE